MQRNRSAHTACILPNRRDIVNSRKLFSNKNRKWFFHSDRLFSLLPLKNPLRKHTSFGKSLTAWRNLAATQIFLFLFRSSKCSAFFCLDYVSPKKKKKRGKDISDTLLSFFFKRIKPDNFQFRISKTTCAKGCKLSKHERNIPSLALFTAAVFICRLLVNLRPASQEAVIWEEFGVVWLIWLFVCIFSQLNFNLIEPCRKFTYLCTLSLKRNASRVSYDTVSPRCTSWKSEKQKKCSW